MVSSAERLAKVDDMDRRALAGPVGLRAEWAATAAHWQALEDSARRHESLLSAIQHPPL